MSRAAGTAKTESGGPRLSRMLAVEAICIGGRAKDWRAAVRLAGDALVASGATTPAYTNEMVATVEQLGPYIVIAPGIALAHARPSPAVRRAAISLVTLLEPVEFGHRENDPVRLVIGLAAVDEEGHITALSTLAEFLSDQTRREGLFKAADAAEVAQMVRAFEESQALETSSADADRQSTAEPS
jgi:ascorbate PTS system EIIA or EIIAB component